MSRVNVICRVGYDLRLEMNDYLSLPSELIDIDIDIGRQTQTFDRRDGLVSVTVRSTYYTP